MPEATAILWTWCYRPWPKSAEKLPVGSPEWRGLDARIGRYMVEGTEEKWAKDLLTMDTHGYVAREVFRFMPGGPPEPIGW